MKKKQWTTTQREKVPANKFSSSLWWQHNLNPWGVFAVVNAKINIPFDIDIVITWDNMQLVQYILWYENTHKNISPV